MSSPIEKAPAAGGTAVEAQGQQSSSSSVIKTPILGNARPCNFTTWLRKQKRRDDRVGDLARDFIEDCRTEQRRFTRRDLSRRVRDGGYSPALVALKTAFGEFRSCRGCL